MGGTDHFSASPHTVDNMAGWQPTAQDLKFYRHFDAPIKLADIPSLYSDPRAVVEHRFMPLLEFEKKWRRAPKNDKTRDWKVRKIRFACRKDAYIYKYYREILSGHYEKALSDLELTNSVLAYRSIPDLASVGHNKTNVEFARDAFSTVQSLGKCAAVAIDISKFFDSLDHGHIKETWCRLLKSSSLPDDHYRVFRSVIKYRYVSRDDAYVALGFSEYDASGVLRYNVDPKSIPLQICPLSDFRDKIVSSGIVKKHNSSYGIPQGLPLSDILANSYLLDFDVYMEDYAKKRGGVYMRYSDDILIILPGDGRAARGAAQVASKKITEFGSQIKINPEKTEIACFTGKDGPNRCYNLLANDTETTRKRIDGNEGLSYLGFRYDGRRVFLRNNTVTNLNGKIARTCRASAHSHVAMHKEKDLKWLLEHAPLQEVKQNFFQVKNFDAQYEEALETGGDTHKVMTFWSYAYRAAKVFKEWDNRILDQLKSLRNGMNERFLDEIKRSHSKRAGREFHVTPRK